MLKTNNILFPNEESASELVNDLIGNLTLSFGIRGGSYMGKTYFLNLLIKKIQEKSKDDVIFFPIFLELSKLRLNQMENLSEVLINGTIQKIFELTGLKFVISNEKTLNEQEPLESIINAIEADHDKNNILKSSIYHIIWIFDDIQVLKNIEWKDRLLSILRSYVDQYSKKFNLIISFKEPDDLIGKMAGSKLYYILESKTLQNLTIVEQKKHIQSKFTDIVMNDQVNSQVYEVTGGNIYFTNKFINYLLKFEKKIEILDQKKIVQYIDFLNNEFSQDFKKQFDELAILDKLILQRMLNKPYLEPYSEIWIKNQLETTEDQLLLRQSISSLISKGIINYIDYNYYIASDLIRKGFSFLLQSNFNNNI